jgi:hypothetical protein
LKTVSNFCNSYLFWETLGLKESLESRLSFKPSVKVFKPLVVKILLSVLELTLYSCYDNKTKFKGKVAQLCKELSIRIVRGQAYHPQTQGTVEQVNCTFK